METIYSENYLASVFSDRDIYDIKEKEISQLTINCLSMANIIEKYWSDIPDSVKEVARMYAYYYMNRQDDNSFKDLFPRLLFILRTISKRKEAKNLQVCIKHLVDVILAAIEKENPNYQKSIKTAIDSVKLT